MRPTRDDKRARALIVTPRGTQRILRPEPARRNPAASFAGGSRSALSIGKGSGVGRGGGGGGGGIGPQASIAAALSGGAFPAAEAPGVFAPQPVSPLLPPDGATVGTGTYTGPPPPLPPAPEWNIGGEVAANPFGLAPGALTPVGPLALPGTTLEPASLQGSYDPYEEERLRLARLSRIG